MPPVPTTAKEPTKVGVSSKDCRIRPPGNKIQNWRVTSQPNRAVLSHCFRCKVSFEPDEARLQAVRESEKVTGKRATDRCMHIGCADAVFPEPCEFVGFADMSEDCQRDFQSKIDLIRMEVQQDKNAKKARVEKEKEARAGESAASCEYPSRRR